MAATTLREWHVDIWVKAAFKKIELIWSAESNQISSHFFKVCPPQILLGPFLNTLTQIWVRQIAILPEKYEVTQIQTPNVTTTLNLTTFLSNKLLLNFPYQINYRAVERSSVMSLFIKPWPMCMSNYKCRFIHTKKVAGYDCTCWIRIT